LRSFALVAALCMAPQPEAEAMRLRAKLTPETSAAFDGYVKLTDARNDREMKAGKDILWIDALPGSARESAYTALRRGEVLIKRVEARENKSSASLVGGMIHHWEGVVFIPEAKLADVVSLLEDYDHQSTYYAPDVERSKTESRDGEHFRVFLRFRRHKVITVVLNSEHDVQYIHDSETLAHSRSSAVRIAEVQDAGKPGERELAPGDDEGFMWRMETWWRLEERDGGVYVQSEVVSLSREIPTGLVWLIGPFVSSVPKESLTFTLAATRKAVQSRKANRN
jgi:hypothetical protein